MAASDSKTLCVCVGGMMCGQSCGTFLGDLYAIMNSSGPITYDASRNRIPNGRLTVAVFRAIHPVVQSDVGLHAKNSPSPITMSALREESNRG